LTRKYRKAISRDRNEGAIVEALERFGAKVHRADFVDLVVGFRKQTYLIEVKDPGAVRGGNTKKQEEKQRAMMAEWNGGKWVIVYGITDALREIGAIGRVEDAGVL